MMGPMAENDPTPGVERKQAASHEGPGTIPRKLALEIILESDGGRRNFIDEGLEARLSGIALPDRDRHLLQEIAYGAVRHRNTLDRLLETYLKLPMKRQRPPVRWSLRLAAYQVVYLTRIPVHSAIDRTIEAAKEVEGSTRRDSGFLNAVLRKLAADILRKDREPLLDADDPTAIPIRSGFCRFRRPVLPLINLDPAAHIAIKHSHPRWMVARWIERFGREGAISICEANNRIPSVVARVTARAPGPDAVLASLLAQGVEGDRLGGGGSFALRRTGDPRKLEALSKGWVQIQDPTATEIGETLRPPAGARVLDLCAAPGGKAVQLLEAVGERGFLVACDIEEEKAAKLEENLRRAGESFEVRRIPSEPEAIDLGEKFSHVLLDAPCSNTGVLARRPEARWRVQPEDLTRLSELQRRLLEAAIRPLAPGGRLVYATCSIEHEEDEATAARAVADHPGLKLVEEKLILPGRHRPDAATGDAVPAKAVPAKAVPADEGEGGEAEGPSPGGDHPRGDRVIEADGGYRAVLVRT
jgi:16S rRNA (cytosine967-C5)-methyltransferase